MTTMTKAVLAGAALFAATQAQAATIELFEFDGLTGEAGNAQINFTGGGNFNFSPTTGANFENSDSGALGLITGNFNITSGAGNFSAVTGNGTFEIGSDFSADLTWQNIGLIESVGGLNVLSAINLSNISYGLNPGDPGFDQDLQDLETAGDGIASLSFTFVPPRSLQELYDGGHSTGFNGDVAIVVRPPTDVPDGGASALLLGLGMLGLGAIRFRK